MHQDPTMEAIGAAVELGRQGNVGGAQARLLELWSEIGVTGDPLHRCTLAHHLADLYDDPVQALAWDVRALDAADAITQERVERHHAGLQIAGFYPSLHLNLADNYRRLACFEAAAEQIRAAEEFLEQLPQDPYGDLVRTAITAVEEAIARRDTSPRPSAPGPGGAR